MEHLAYINFFEDAARRHWRIAHEQPLPGGNSRQSFFRMSQEEEMQQAIMNDASFPALCLQLYQGKLAAADKQLIREWLYGSFEIRDQVDDHLNVVKVEECRARCKKIAEEVVALMVATSEDTCSIFKSLDINSMRYRFTGPINTGEYGCQYFFTWKSNAVAINGADLETVFSL